MNTRAETPSSQAIRSIADVGSTANRPRPLSLRHPQGYDPASGIAAPFGLFHDAPVEGSPMNARRFCAGTSYLLLLLVNKAALAADESTAKLPEVPVVRP